VTATPDDFDRFSEQLDREWMRRRLRADSLQIPDDVLLREIGRADPLSQGPTGWLADLRRILAVWPGRLACATAALILLVVGGLVGRQFADTPPTASVRVIPPLPAYQSIAGARLGGAAPANPSADEKFRAAMAHHPSRDFAVRALPLLREAVSLDPGHDAAQFWLGVALLHVDRPAEAVGPLEQAVRLAPADREYKQYLLFAYFRTGAVAKASALLTELMRGSPR
jgi:tetratricopeptide (TPR) repeat protein